MGLKSKCDSLKKILIKNRLTTPQIMGSKILFLATAPCVQDYFDYKSVREQFRDYDLACINYMLIYSTDYVFKWHPKYFILLDSIFYQGSIDVNSEQFNAEKQKVVNILEKVDWECYIVTSVLADFRIQNKNVHYIFLSCFAKSYNNFWYPLFKRNFLNLGIYNVIQGAVYFGITFGYKEIAILGCTYKYLMMEMKKDGLHIYNHNHYYDLKRLEEVIDYNRILQMRDGFIATMYRRAVNSYKCCWELQKYASRMGCHITNYSKESMIDAFQMGDLCIEEDEI